MQETNMDDLPSSQDSEMEIHPPSRSRKALRRIDSDDDDGDSDGSKENVKAATSGDEELDEKNHDVAKGVVGTFEEDGYDTLLSQEVDKMDETLRSNGKYNDDLDSNSITEESENEDNGRGRRAAPRRITTEDEDEYDTDFIDDGDVNSSDDDYESNDEFEMECNRINAWQAPDPYMPMLTPKRNGISEKRKKPRKGMKRPRAKKQKRNRSDSECSSKEEFEESSDNDDCVSDVQEVSIHQIKMNHWEFRNLLEGPHPEEEIINFVIKKQNNQNKNNPEYKEKPVVKSLLPVMLKADNLCVEEEDLEPFEIKIFAQVIPRRPALMTAYGVKDVTSQVCHTLIFHYREGEIFVLTTNQAWNVVQWCSDFGFPGKVAARILSRKGTVEVTKKGLIGNDFMSKRTHNQIQESNPFDLLTFCTGYTTCIEVNASILNLHCFKSQRPQILSEPEKPKEDEVQLVHKPGSSASPNKSPKGVTPTKQGTYSKKQGPPSTVKVTVSQAAVRFLKRFRPSDFLAILNHLSRIARNQPTVTVDGKEEEDSSVHVQYLQPVQIELARELDLALAMQVHSAIADNRHMASLQNYEFTHKHFMDFFNGREFFLSYGVYQKKHWKNAPPTLTEIIHALRGIEELTNVEPGTGEDSYKKKLDKCKINYLTRDGKPGGNLKNGEKVLNFIQGMLFHPRHNSVYWHIKGLWCNLEPSYILLIQGQLLDLIQQHLRDSTTLGLKFPWPVPDNTDCDGIPEDEEHFKPATVLAIEAYLDQYRDRPNYFVSSSPGSDIVDMIKINKTATEMSMNQTMTTDNEKNSKLTLFYMISSLSHKVISQGVRITNSLTGLKKGTADIVSAGGSAAGATRRQGVGGSELNLQELQKLYELVKLKPNFRQVAPTFDKFRTLLRDATVVVGIGKESALLARTLEEEGTVPISIEPMHIEEQLRNLDANDVSLRSMAEKLGAPDDLAELASRLHHLMITNELIGSDNTITSKLVALSPISEPIPELKEFSTFLNEHIIKAFQPSGSTFLAKMELIRIRRYVMTLGIRKFFIAEIPQA